MKIISESKIKRTAVITYTLLFGIFCVILVNCKGPSTGNWENIEAGFQNPPNSAKPRVWWHWMNGNVTKEGIRADLEWLNNIGVAGFQNFDAGLSSPQIVENRLVYMTPEWKDAFLFTAKLADSLGMEMAIAGSPGWSESGGPWVTPEQGMKKYVWSEIQVAGGQPFSDTLPQPPSATGGFQNISTEGRSYNELITETLPEYYADAAVVAFRIPDSDISLTELQPKITSSGGRFTIQSLTDGNLTESILLPLAPVGQKSWIQFEFSEPQTIQAITLVTGGGRGMGFRGGGGSGNQTLEASDDGQQFKTILEIPSGDSPQNTFSFSPETARYFRFSILTPEPQARPGTSMPVGWSFMQPPGPSGTPIAELVLHTGARVNRFEDKAGFAATIGLNSLPTPSVSDMDIISTDNVIDLTSEMAADGTLKWTPPEEKWVIMRLGYSLTGHQNGPASPEATGLEVDKLNPDFVKAYFENYLSQYEDATGGLMGERGLQYIITDSWEAGVANWTNNMIEEFNNRNSYDILPWLPVLTGHVVESAEASDRFLWDFRNTLIAMVAEYHYDELTTILHERGMGRYTESHENGRAFIGDGMEVKRAADIPMSATWATPTPSQIRGGIKNITIRHKADVRESASVAHIYGQNLVAAESLTAIGSTWAFSPERLKPTADMELASGLNRFVIHTSVHQPSDDKIPGLGLGPFGQWFTRHETWAGQAEPWISYLARSCYLLQQGKFVADIIYMYGEDYNITALFGNELPKVPEGYAYDFVNADALLNILSTNKGLIVTPSGMSYCLLVLDESTQYMSVPVIRKLQELVNAGAIVVGPKPIKTPSLNDNEDEFKTIANELWGTGTGIQSVGKGKVYAGQTIAEVLDALEIEPDFAYTKPQNDTEILYVHRTLNSGEIYWVNNLNNRFEQVEASFRVDGKAAEIWNPETGDIKQASYIIKDGKTTVPLNLKPNDAVFVVFREDAETSTRIIPTCVETQVAIIEGPWEVSFQPNRGAPAQITLQDLTPWNENSDSGVKYFSGTGTYFKAVQVPAEWLEAGQEIWINLGNVKYLAEVLLNGQSLGIVWKNPFRVNITDALQEGENMLQVKVTNLWVNRLIGDQQPGVTNPCTYTTQAFYQADSPLLPSGLLGPVQIVSLSTD
jgi:hypothetical protein